MLIGITIGTVGAAACDGETWFASADRSALWGGGRGPPVPVSWHAASGACLPTSGSGGDSSSRSCGRSAPPWSIGDRCPGAGRTGG